MTPTRKALIRQEVAMLLSEKGLETISDVRTLLNQNLLHLGNDLTAYNKTFGCWGDMLRVLQMEYPDLMELAKTPKPKAESKPKAAAKPAAKPAVNKGK